MFPIITTTTTTTISMETMKPYQILWRIFGVWPPSSNRTDRWLYYIYSLTIHTIFAVLFNVCLLLALLEANSIADVIDICLPASSTCMSGIKMMIFVWHRQLLPPFFIVIQRIESLSRGDRTETKLIVAAQRKNHNLVRMLATSTAIVIFGLIFVWSLSTEHQLFWPAMYPFNWQTNQALYAAAMVYQIVCTIFIATFLMLMDQWRSAAYHLILGYLEILNGRLRRLGGGKTTKRLAEIQLTECIQYHHLCVQLIKIVEELCAVYYLGQFANSVFIVCVTSYLLAEVLGGKKYVRKSLFSFTDESCGKCNSIHFLCVLFVCMLHTIVITLCFWYACDERVR